MDIPQTLTEYIERNYADDYDWLVLTDAQRRSRAADEITEGWDSLTDALDGAALTSGRGDEIARYTGMGYGISPALLAEAIAYKADLWLRNSQNDCLRARGDHQFYNMASIYHRALALACVRYPGAPMKKRE